MCLATHEHKNCDRRNPKCDLRLFILYRLFIGSGHPVQLSYTVNDSKSDANVTAKINRAMSDGFI